MALQDDIALMQSQLNQWDSEINRLNSDIYVEAENAKQQVLRDGQQRIEALRKQRNEAQQQLEGLRQIASQTP